MDTISMPSGAETGALVTALDRAYESVEPYLIERTRVFCDLVERNTPSAFFEMVDDADRDALRRVVSLLVFAISTRVVYEIPDQAVRAYAACVETLLDLESALAYDEPEGAPA